MLLLLALSTASVFTQETVRIYGRVTDFNDNPIDSVTVRVKNKNLKIFMKPLPIVRVIFR